MDVLSLTSRSAHRPLLELKLPRSTEIPPSLSHKKKIPRPLSRHAEPPCLLLGKRKNPAKKKSRRCAAEQPRASSPVSQRLSLPLVSPPFSCFLFLPAPHPSLQLRSNPCLLPPSPVLLALALVGQWRTLDTARADLTLK